MKSLQKSQYIGLVNKVVFDLVIGKVQAKIVPAAAVILVGLLEIGWRGNTVEFLRSPGCTELKG